MTLAITPDSSQWSTWSTTVRLVVTDPDALATAREPALPAELDRLAALVDGRGACHHPDGSVRMLRTALRTFGTDVQAHLAGWCTAATPLESR